MSKGPTTTRPLLDIVVQRRLEVISSGNCAYLETFLTAAKEANLRVRLICAPWRSFANRPWATIHPRLSKQIDEVVWPSSAKIGQRYLSTSLQVWLRFAFRVCKEIPRRLGFKIQFPTYFSTPLDERERRKVSALLKKQGLASITVAEYSALGGILGDLPQDETVHAVLMHDVLSDRGPAIRAFGMTPNFPEMSADEEASWVSSSKLNIFASRNEMESFGPRIPDAKNVWLRPKVPHFSAPSENGPIRIVFIGTQHAGNVDSLEHFYDDIWPIIRQKIPDAELHIAGSTGPALPKRIQTAEGIKILGRVDDLSDLGGPQTITIAPTRVATGVSIKVAEYLLLRTACVAYPRAIQGFGGALDTLLEICETETEFADTIVWLYKDHKARRALANKAGDETPNRLANDEVVAALRIAAESIKT